MEITRHAYDQAIARGIDGDLLRGALLKGKVERYGKHGIKFVSKGRKRTITCVGEIRGDTIVIFTAEA